MTISFQHISDPELRHSVMDNLGISAMDNLGISAIYNLGISVMDATWESA